MALTDLQMYDMGSTTSYAPLVGELAQQSFQWGNCCTYLRENKYVCNTMKSALIIGSIFYIAYPQVIVMAKEYIPKINAKNLTSSDYIILGSLGVFDIAALTLAGLEILNIINSLRGRNAVGNIRENNALRV